jgi:nucleoside-diphosphate-sugar epimerase
VIRDGARVFVTGATGAAGRYVVAELRSRGLSVIALVRRAVHLDGVHTVVGDLARIEDVAPVVAASDGVVHLASTRSQERDAVLERDVLGTARLLDAWARGPFVYASSQTIYGVPTGPLTESTPVDVGDWYDLGKHCCEFAVRKADEADSSRGPGISLRPPLLFSPLPGQFLDLVLRECLAGRTFFFDSEEGFESYGSSYVGGVDFAAAVAASLELSRGGAFNVAAGYCRWRDLLDAFEAARLPVRVVIRPGGRAEPHECRLPQSRSELDDALFRERTGFRPRRAWPELVDELLAARGIRPARGPSNG